MFNFSLYLLPFIVSSVVQLGLAILIWRLRKGLPAKLMLAFIACLQIWIIGFIFELATSDLQLKIILANIQFIGIDAVPVIWLFLTLSYTGQVNSVKRFSWIFVTVLLINQLVIWTDPWHHLFRSNPGLDTTSLSIPLLANNYSYWYYIVQMPSVYLIYAATVLILIYAMRFTFGAQRRQIFFYLLA